MTSSSTQNGSARNTWFKKRKKYSERDTIGKDLEFIELDHAVKTGSEENRKRRTLNVTRVKGQSWGFTLQSYGIQHPGNGTVDTLTYVDYVDFGGPASEAGMQTGDVILSINGVSMECKDHGDLIDHVTQQGERMRLVVLFEDCVRKVELHLRLRKLKKLLAAKEFELRSLELREQRVLNGINSLSESRWSLRSSVSGMTLPMSRDALSLHADMNYNSIHPGSINSSPQLRKGILRHRPIERAASSTCFGDAVPYDMLPLNTSAGARSASPCAGSVMNMSIPEGSVYEDGEGWSSPNIVLNPRVDVKYTSLPTNARKRARAERVGNSKFYKSPVEGATEGDADSIRTDRDSLFDPELSHEQGIYQTWDDTIPDLNRDSGNYNTWSGNRKKKRRGETRYIGNSLFYVESENNISQDTMNSTTNKQDSNASLSYEAMGARPKAKYSTCSDSQLSVRSKKDKRIKARQNAMDESPDLNLRRTDDALNNYLVTSRGAIPRRPSSLPIIPADEEVSFNLDTPNSVFHDSGSESPVFLDTPLKQLPTSSPLVRKPADRLSQSKSDITILRSKSKGKVVEPCIKKRTSESPKNSPLMSMKKLFTRSPSLPSLHLKSKWSPLEFTRNKLRNSLSKLRRKSGSYKMSGSKLSLAPESSDSELTRSASAMTLGYAPSDNDISEIEVYATLPKKHQLKTSSKKTPTATTINNPSVDSNANDIVETKESLISKGSLHCRYVDGQECHGCVHSPDTEHSPNSQLSSDRESEPSDIGSSVRSVNMTVEEAPPASKITRSIEDSPDFTSKSDPDVHHSISHVSQDTYVSSKKYKHNKEKQNVRKDTKNRGNTVEIEYHTNDSAQDKVATDSLHSIPTTEKEHSLYTDVMSAAAFQDKDNTSPNNLETNEIPYVSITYRTALPVEPAKPDVDKGFSKTSNVSSSNIVLDSTVSHKEDSITDDRQNSNQKPILKIEDSVEPAMELDVDEGYSQVSDNSSVSEESSDESSSDEMSSASEEVDSFLERVIKSTGTSNEINANKSNTNEDSEICKEKNIDKCLTRNNVKNHPSDVETDTFDQPKELVTVQESKAKLEKRNSNEGKCDSKVAKSFKSPSASNREQMVSDTSDSAKDFYSPRRRASERKDSPDEIVCIESGLFVTERRLIVNATDKVKDKTEEPVAKSPKIVSNKVEIDPNDFHYTKSSRLEKPPNRRRLKHSPARETNTETGSTKEKVSSQNKKTDESDEIENPAVNKLSPQKENQENKDRRVNDSTEIESKGISHTTRTTRKALQSKSRSRNDVVPEFRSRREMRKATITDDVAAADKMPSMVFGVDKSELKAIDNTKTENTNTANKKNIIPESKTTLTERSGKRQRYTSRTAVTISSNNTSDENKSYSVTSRRRSSNSVPKVIVNESMPKDNAVSESDVNKNMEKSQTPRTSVSNTNNERASRSATRRAGSNTVTIQDTKPSDRSSTSKSPVRLSVPTKLSAYGAHIISRSKSPETMSRHFDESSTDRTRSKSAVGLRQRDTTVGKRSVMAEDQTKNALQRTFSSGRLASSENSTKLTAHTRNETKVRTNHDDREEKWKSALPKTNHTDIRENNVQIPSGSGRADKKSTSDLIAESRKLRQSVFGEVNRQTSRESQPDNVFEDPKETPHVPASKAHANRPKYVPLYITDTSFANKSSKSENKFRGVIGKSVIQAAHIKRRQSSDSDSQSNTSGSRSRANTTSSEDSYTSANGHWKATDVHFYSRNMSAKEEEEEPVGEKCTSRDTQKPTKMQNKSSYSVASTSIKFAENRSEKKDVRVTNRPEFARKNRNVENQCTNDNRARIAKTDPAESIVRNIKNTGTVMAKPVETSPTESQNCTNSKNQQVPFKTQRTSTKLHLNPHRLQSDHSINSSDSKSEHMPTMPSSRNMKKIENSRNILFNAITQSMNRDAQFDDSPKPAIISSSQSSIRHNRRTGTNPLQNVSNVYHSDKDFHEKRYSKYSCETEL